MLMISVGNGTQSSGSKMCMFIRLQIVCKNVIRNRFLLVVIFFLTVFCLFCVFFCTNLFITCLDITKQFKSTKNISCISYFPALIDCICKWPSFKKKKKKSSYTFSVQHNFFLYIKPFAYFNFSLKPLILFSSQQFQVLLQSWFTNLACPFLYSRRRKRHIV